MSFGEKIGITPLAINGFLWDTMKQINPDLEEIYGDTVPFYPVADSAAGDSPWEDKPYFIYDRVFRFNGKPFHEHKRESILYYLKANDIDSLEWSGALQAILDREDDAAQDINSWIRSQENGPEDYPYYFHNLRVYQSRSSSPSSEGKMRDVSTVQPYYITEFMIDAHFHFTKQLTKIKRVEDMVSYPQGGLDKNGNPVMSSSGIVLYDYDYDFVCIEIDNT